MYQVKLLRGTLGAIRQESGGFTCNKTICYSWNSPTTHALFMRLQELLNKAAKKAGVSGATSIDGKIGAQTVALASLIAQKRGLGNSPTYLTRLAMVEGVTKENLAKHSDVLVPDLAYYVGEDPGIPVQVGPQGTLPNTETLTTVNPTVQTVPHPTPGTPAYPSATYPEGANAVAQPPPGTSAQFPSAGTQITVQVPAAAAPAPSAWGPAVGIGAVLLAVGGAVAFALSRKGDL